MIDEILEDYILAIGEVKENEYLPTMVKIIEKANIEAKTAIYEIGLEKIGKDEKLLSIQDCPDLESANAVLAKNKLMVVRNKLRFEQRYAWAKACGVAEK